LKSERKTKRPGLSLKGTGFSPYIDPAKSVGLQPLRDSLYVNLSLISACAWFRFHQNPKPALSLPSVAKQAAEKLGIDTNLQGFVTGHDFSRAANAAK
jgi:hypothetical protein